MEFVIAVIILVLIAAVVWRAVNRRGASRNSAPGSPSNGTGASPDSVREPSTGTQPHVSGAATSTDAAASAGSPSASASARPSSSLGAPDAEDDDGVAGRTPAEPVFTSDSAAEPEPQVEDSGARQRTAGDRAGEERPAGQPAAGKPQAADPAAEDRAEWQTQWSDAGGTPTVPPSALQDASTGQKPLPVPAAGVTTPAPQDFEQDSPAVAPAGLLAAEQPYGEGSASPGPDGEGPEGYAVKGDAAAMVYYDESDPRYEDAVCHVWFVSPAHAEAAGFREPRRLRR